VDFVVDDALGCAAGAQPPATRPAPALHVMSRSHRLQSRQNGGRLRVARERGHGPVAVEVL
jgi:hypothetical protein